MSDIEEVRLHWLIEPLGDRRVWLSGEWPEHVGVTDQLLELADPAFITSGDGMVRFFVENGGALYGYAHPDSAPDAHHYDLIEEAR